MEKETALYIGRFQPFHKGHLSVIKQIERAEDVGEIIVGIGSSETSLTPENPFNADEREAMVRQNLEKFVEKPWQLVRIPDVGNDQKWFSLVKLLSPSFRIVYTNNDWVSTIFKNDNYAVRNPIREYPISATEVRKLIKEGGEWKQHVPEGTIEVLAKIKGVDRIRTQVRGYTNPAVTADLIIDYASQGVVLIQRKDNLKWALPGGHMETGRETIEGTGVREAKEETNLDITLSPEDQFRVYSHPHRDHRGHYVAVVFHKKIEEGVLKAADDAKDAKIFPWDQLPSEEELSFDHYHMLKDFVLWRKTNQNGH